MLVITVTVHARSLLGDLRRWLQSLIARPTPVPAPVPVRTDPRR